MFTDEQRAYHRDWYHKNKEARRAASRKTTKSWRLKNPEAAKAADKRWKAKNPNHLKNYLLKKTYGITLEQRDQMFLDQGSRCAICKGDIASKWHVDHCHETKRVRGILCSHCNLMIGHAKDNPQTLLSAVEYLNDQTLIKR